MATNKVTRKTTEKKGDLIKFYRDMLLIRRFEEKAGQLYGCLLYTSDAADE